MNKFLIIGGLTSTGKTSFAVEVAQKYNGELISADSRQVYKGMDIITGKDRELLKNTPVWLYDVVNPDEPFSVSLWRHKALEAIQNIHNRGKLPVVVGGTGLYLRSLITNLETVNIPPDSKLRRELSKISVSDLFLKLQKINPVKANSLNNSDRHNPRRLIRAIEVAGNQSAQHPSTRLGEGWEVRYLVLTSTKENLLKRISDRVHQRINAGATLEFQNLLSKYPQSLSSFSACGYQSLLKSQDPQVWIRSEYQYARRQSVFFHKYFPHNHVDISNPIWSDQALGIISTWINTS